MKCTNSQNCGFVTTVFYFKANLLQMYISVLYGLNKDHQGQAFFMSSSMPSTRGRDSKQQSITDQKQDCLSHSEL